MRYLYPVLLALLVAGCSSPARVAAVSPSFTPAPALAVEPGDAWYIVPAGATLPGYATPLPTPQYEVLPAETRYQVTGTSGPYLSVLTSTGETYWVSPASAPTRYTPTDDDVERHDRLDRERTTCAATADPQAALAAGHSELDADGDGIACERGHSRATSQTAPATPSARAPSYAPSSGSPGGPVRVRGYTRRDGTRVAPHSRSRPRSGGRRP